MVIVMAATLAVGAVGDVRIAVGRASSPDSGEILYTEQHFLERDNAVSLRIVLYRCPDGRPFARTEVAGFAQLQRNADAGELATARTAPLDGDCDTHD